jgi:hypothetical protein
MKETTTGADLYDEVMQFLNFSAEKVAWMTALNQTEWIIPTLKMS